MNHAWENGRHPFYVVESHVCPENYDGKTCPKAREGFRTELLQDDEIFDTDFIGASVEDCQKWLQEKQPSHNFMVDDLLFIADARSAKDDTILVKDYHEEGIDFPEPLGLLPPEGNTWYEFRIHYKDADEIWNHLCFQEPDMAYPIYYQRKGEVTDENGVFSVSKAQAIILGKKD